MGITAAQFTFQEPRVMNGSLQGIDRQTAQNLVDGAHRRCPYSKAVHGNIHVVTTVVEAGATIAA
jgi:organic hydroperoxide reductase OsmC/OhrA